MSGKELRFEDRKLLMEEVHKLPETELWKVIELVFGVTDVKEGREFEVNFATLDTASCYRLARQIGLRLSGDSAPPSPVAKKAANKPKPDKRPASSVGDGAPASGAPSEEEEEEDDGVGGGGGGAANGKEPSFAERGAELVGARVQVCLEGKAGPWLDAAVKRWLPGAGKHNLLFSDGKMRKLDLDTVAVNIVEMASKEDDSNQSGELVGTLRTGVPVWAKASGHPWWPAEVVLPVAAQLRPTLPPPAPPRRGGPNHIMVLYSGESQYDLLPPTSVQAFELTDGKKALQRARAGSVGAGGAGWRQAYQAFLRRCRELQFDTAGVELPPPGS